MVPGEAAPFGKTNIEYYLESLAAVYSASIGTNRVRRVNVNCAPLTVAEFKQFKAAGIGTYQIFQETYHDKTYKEMHPKGPKSDPDNRIDAVDRAFLAGIDDVGIGALLGLYDHKFEMLGLLSHVEYLEKRFNVGPHTISVPRLEPASGSSVSINIPYKLSDEEFKQAVAVLRLSVPYTGIIMSTRETPELRNELFDLGVSQISAASRVDPGGYTASERHDTEAQFCLGDNRTLDEVMGKLIEKGFIPSFCAACYRKERTGKEFMKLARPGTIKGKCRINAVITLKEYLDDFASPGVKEKGALLISNVMNSMPEEERAYLNKYLSGVKDGKRDQYV